MKEKPLVYESYFEAPVKLNYFDIDHLNIYASMPAVSANETRDAVILKWVALVGDRWYNSIHSLTIDPNSAQFNFTDEAKDNFHGLKIINIRVARIQGNRFISVQYSNLVESGYNLDEQEFENLYQMARNR